MIKCNHDLAERKTAVADGKCPICMGDRIKELESALQAIASDTVIGPMSFRNQSYRLIAQEALQGHK